MRRSAIWNAAVLTVLLSAASTGAAQPGGGRTVPADLAEPTARAPAATGAAAAPLRASRPRRSVASPAEASVPGPGRPAEANRRCGDMLCPLYLVLGNGY